MISVTCNTDSSIIKFIEILGHSSGSDDDKIICAAVSCLTRTACEIMTRLNGVVSEFYASEPGSVVLLVHDYKKSVQDKLSGISDFLLLGLIGIIRDYPESIKLKINNKEWYDGSQKRWW